MKIKPKSTKKTAAKTLKTKKTSPAPKHPEKAATLKTEPPKENIRTGLSVAALRQAFLDNLVYDQGRFPAMCSQHDYYMALARTVRDRMLRRALSTTEIFMKQNVKGVAYLSAEFLLGPLLANYITNLGIEDNLREALSVLGLNLDDLLEQEEEPGLGNGGLGRLAACYLDSLATLEIPAFGYGIRYEYGIFDQEIRDGWQVEKTDKWLRYGNPWEIPRPERAQEIKFGGRTESYTDDSGRFRIRWIPDRVVRGVPYDTRIMGYRVNTCNVLRLWTAEAVESFDFQAFNVGDYYRAVDAKILSENLTKVLYPNDEPVQGKRLRLEQQYFFVSCSLQDMIRIHTMKALPLEKLPESFTIQMNDTHPAVAVAELMRILIDEHLMEWEKAWEITRRCLAYTNHTLLPEALEKWPLPLFGRVLPRHLQIIFEINRRLLDAVRQRYPGDDGKVSRMSLIDESGDRYIRMANLATIGSHAVNGVAELHTALLKRDVLSDFAQILPEKFLNVTNGVTPRRFLVVANAKLAALISGKIGESWITNLEELRRLEPFAAEAGFRKQWRDIKQDNKERLAEEIARKTGTVVDPFTLFDIQVKRIHEYKRQHLKALHILTMYARLKRNPKLDIVPRTFIFGGKAAPGYFMAKLIIKFINALGETVNSDPDVRGRLKIVFVPDYNVKNSEHVYPAADLSEQISLAGKEASGTGNMKFTLNGALTIGTLDGANVEIREEVGAENFFLFGLTAEAVQQRWHDGYRPYEYYEKNAELREILDLVNSGHFSHGDRLLFKPLIDSLLYHDPYMLLADYQDYIRAQEQVDEMYRDKERWTKMSILNVARAGKFSSDRAIREYAEKIWKVKPVPVDLQAFPENVSELYGRE